MLTVSAIVGPFSWLLEPARYYWGRYDFRLGVGWGVALALVLWMLVRLWRAWRRHLRKPRPEQIARELGVSDERVDAYVLQQVVTDPTRHGLWQQACQGVQGAESQLERAKEQKGLLLAQMAQSDRELATLLAKRRAAGGTTLEVRTIRDLAADHAAALLQGAAAWAAYRASCPRPPSLAGADLSGMDLSRYDLRGVEFYRAVLVGCRFDGADLGGADLIASCCTGASFAGARLDGALLSRADLSHCDLRAASLVGVELSRASFVGAHMDGARMKGSRLEHTIMPDGSESSGWVAE